MSSAIEATKVKRRASHRIINVSENIFLPIATDVATFGLHRPVVRKKNIAETLPFLLEMFHFCSHLFFSFQVDIAMIPI